MNLNQYTITGDPQQVLAMWSTVVAELGKEDLLLHVVAVGDEGITVLDVCPTEEDFQGWINGDDWRRIKAELGGAVTVTRLGEVTSVVARDTLVEVVGAPAHAH
jgi:hypothetical protein